MILSASQIETYDDSTPFGCALKWWWAYPQNKRGPRDDPSLILGETVHGTIENFLGNLQAPVGVLHDLALPGAGFLSDLRPSIRVIEKGIELEDKLELSGCPVVGRIDALATSTRADIRLIDWKTTSNIAKYAKTPGQLQTNIQLMIYAYWLLDYGVETIELTHGYIQTKRGKKFEVVNALVDRAHVLAQIAKIEAVVDRMKADYVKTDPLTLDYDDLKCSLGYGCPHRAYCPRSGDVMASLFDAFKQTPVVNPGPEAPAEVVRAEGVLPPDAPARETAPKRENMQIKDVVPPAAEELPAPPQVGPSPEQLAETPKRGPGRPRGAQNKPKPSGGAPTEAPAAAGAESTAAPSSVTIERITIRHGIKVGMPNFSSATVEVEYGAVVHGNPETAREIVSMACRRACEKEIELYVRKKEEIEAKKAQ
jgi:hypothetical protein